MAKIIKAKPKPHVLIVDTNILWCEDKKPAVNSDFESFWAENKNLVRLELIVPAVVRDELLFQQTTSCSKLLDKVNDDVRELSAIAAKHQKHAIRKNHLIRQVTKKVDKWISGKNATVVPIPVAQIDWNNVCTSALWRLPPFTFDPKTPKTEKGFRDALIFETVKHLVANETREVNIAFVSNDNLLRRTVAENLKSQHRFSCYEKLADFSSYIKLTREALTNEFIKKLVRKAGEKFFTDNDPNCLWTKDDLGKELLKDTEAFQIEELVNPLSNFQLGNILAQPITGVGSLTFGYQGTILGSPVVAEPPQPAWAPDVNVNPAWIQGSSEFQLLDGARTYHWKTPITFYRKYIGKPTGLELVNPPLRIQKVRFSIYWKADVKADARFHVVLRERIVREKKEFRDPIDEDRKFLNLDGPG